jgi:hypothetical protein
MKVCLTEAGVLSSSAACYCLIISLYIIFTAWCTHTTIELYLYIRWYKSEEYKTTPAPTLSWCNPYRYAIRRWLV